MKFLVSLFTFAVAVAAINATCLHCTNNNDDHQEIKFEDLKYLDVVDRDDQLQYANAPKNVADKFRIFQKVVKKFPIYTREAQRDVKLSDSLNLIDSTELFSNGAIQYRNAFVNGVNNAIMTEVNFDEADKNMFSVSATLKKVRVAGDYTVANANKKEIGQFFIALKDVEFKGKFAMDKFMEVRSDVDCEWISIGDHESVYTNEELMKGLEKDNAAGDNAQKPYAFYYNYLNQVIKARIANEMAVGFAPLIAKRFEQTLNASILFPVPDAQVPKSNAMIAPGIQATVYDTVLRDIWSTDRVQKLTNYTVNEQGQIEYMFCFTTYGLKGTNNWALEYSTTGSEYTGRASFAVDNVQTIVVATKANEQQGPISMKFVKTTVNGLDMLLDNDDNCESVRFFVHQRIPKLLEHSLKTYMSQTTEASLKNLFALIGEKYQQQ